MLFSHQTRGAMAQTLAAVSDNAARNFIYKHLGKIESKMPRIRELLRDAPEKALQSMLIELISNNHTLRSAAAHKDIFDSSVEELKRWASHDGWIIEEGILVRGTPMAENVTGLRDKLILDLAASGLDSDNEIREAIEGSSKNFVAQDFNGSITKSRIALETVARRAATEIASTRAVSCPEDSWGKALQFLRSHDVIEKQEEVILAQVYTFTSPGTHVPKGIMEEEWAMLARTFALSSTYFLLRKFIAA